jgi:hypothetical protein
MPSLDVRFPLPEFNAFFDLDPRDEEVDAVCDCLDGLKRDPERGDPVPFAQYHQYPECRVIECLRFLVVYTFDDEAISVIAVLLDWDYA